MQIVRWRWLFLFCLTATAAFCASPLLGSTARWNTYCVMRRDLGARDAAANTFVQALRDGLHDARLVG